MEKEFLTLLDGREIELFPRIASKMSEKDVLEEQENSKDVLFKNIKLLYDNAEKILTDSRMFLALLPDAGGLMYGTSRLFEKPTLGTFIQWWMTSEHTHFVKDGKEQWIWNFGGSPLSGMNICKTISEDGDHSRLSVTSFKDIWQPFLEINKRYQGLSASYEHYTLNEIVKMLKNIK